MIPGKKGKIVSNTFLRIEYKDKDDEKHSIYFEECSNLKGMVKAFSKYKYWRT